MIISLKKRNFTGIVMSMILRGMIYFKSFEIRHKFMMDRLKYDRERIANELMKEVSDSEEREKVDALPNMPVRQIL